MGKDNPATRYYDWSADIKQQLEADPELERRYFGKVQDKLAEIVQQYAADHANAVAKYQRS